MKESHQDHYSLLAFSQLGIFFWEDLLSEMTFKASMMVKPISEKQTNDKTAGYESFYRKYKLIKSGKVYQKTPPVYISQIFTRSINISSFVMASNCLIRSIKTESKQRWAA